MLQLPLKLSRIRLKLLVLLAAYLFVSCNTTRFVPQDKYLLSKVSIKTDNKSLNETELRAHIRQKENLKILGMFKFHLGMYNLSSSKRENDWFKRIGEAPVIYDPQQTLKSIGQMQVYLRNKGYYNAVITDSLFFRPHRRKVEQVYQIRSGDPYRIRNYTYDITDPVIREIVLGTQKDVAVKPGDIFDVDVLNRERSRISRVLKNQGYYYFTDDYVQYKADSSLFSHQVDLTLEIGRLSGADSSDVAFKRYKIRNFVVNPDYLPPHLQKGSFVEIPDTLRELDYLFLHSGTLKYRPQVFYALNRIPDSTYYCLSNVEKTYRALSRLRQFKVISISFDDVSQALADSVGLLDTRFQLTPLSRQGISADLEGTNSSGNFGVAGNLNYQHRNLFRGAEVLDFKIKGAMERQQSIGENSNINFNTREFGVETGLTVPKFFSPIRRTRLFAFQSPETKLTFAYNYQRRPDYTRTITTMKFGYNWKTSQFKSNSLNLFDINYVHLFEFNPDFIDQIKDQYIKSSFTDHLIFAMNYSWVYNTQNINKRTDYTFFNVNFESAGNMLSAISALTGRSKISVTDTVTGAVSDYYRAFGMRFAQYLKSDFEFRYGHIIDKYSSVVGRAFLGVGVPYGNLGVLPFEKKYFTGGANGIRAWQVRSLGPGNYKADVGSYPNQSSDIKIESNLEYRFKLLLMMEGAIFLDAGNIWAINSKEDGRDGAIFKINEFYKQIAVGTGFGMRFDFNYFLFRLDLGFKLRDPSLEAGKRWIPGNYKINAQHFNLSFAIGYPF